MKSMLISLTLEPMDLFKMNSGISDIVEHALEEVGCIYKEYKGTKGGRKEEKDGGRREGNQRKLS